MRCTRAAEPSAAYSSTWLGHGSIGITSRYLHHLGDFADRSALQLLNQNPLQPAPAAAHEIRDQRAERPTGLGRIERRATRRGRSDPGLGRKPAPAPRRRGDSGVIPDHPGRPPVIPKK